MKKLLSLAVALAMALSLALPAAAAEASPSQSGPQVMLNGEYISFPDVQPELKNGRTMVPFRILAEALGGTVTYSQDGTVSCTMADGTALSFVLGEDSVRVTSGGSTETVSMDVACYYKNGRTMVPVRFFAEALSYQVLWDYSAECAVILDSQALIDAVNARFTAVNQALARLALDSEKTYQSTLDFTLDMNLEYEGHSLPLSLGVHAEALTSVQGMELKGHLDLTDLLTSELLEALLGTDALTQADLLMLRQTFSKVEFQVIYHYADATYYLQLPLLETLSDGAIDGKSWLKYSLNSEDVDVLLEAMGISSLAEMKEESLNTLGGFLYAFCNAADIYTSSWIWEDVMNAAEILELLLGDENLTRTASGWRCTVDAGRLEELLGEPEGSISALFDRLECTLDLPNSGPITLKLDILSKADEWGDRIAVTGSGSFSALKTSYVFTLEIDGLGSFQMNLNTTSSASSRTPASAPPAGAAIVDLNDPYALEDSGESAA